VASICACMSADNASKSRYAALEKMIVFIALISQNIAKYNKYRNAQKCGAA